MRFRRCTATATIRKSNPAIRFLGLPVVSRNVWQSCEAVRRLIRFKENDLMTVFDKHRKAIAIKTLKLSDAGAFVMGGMSKAEARAFLRSIGWTAERISSLENS